ncbi:MAG: DUF6261 family protein [Puniceicoccales bacterium]|jgi:hypothetical protein|nr:DUF6261 family protein [Puniceicoccales bacterium]
MKNTIRTVEFSRLRNEEHFEFHFEFKQLVSECVLTGAFQSLVSIYRQSFEELNDSLEVIRKSIYTGQMVTADKWRDATYRRIRFAVEEFQHHFDPEKCLAAEKVFIVIRHYGDISRAARDNKTSAFMNMIQDLRDKRIGDLQLLGLVDWMCELEENNERYRRLKEQRYTEQAQQPAKKVWEARQAVDADYETIMYHMAVHMKLNPSDEVVAMLATEISARVNSYRWLLAQRRGIAKMNILNPVCVDSSS